MNRFNKLAVLTLTLQLYSYAGDALAQTVHQNPKGAPIGTMLWFPSLELSYRTDDNIYAVQDKKTSDKITGVKAGIDASSDWNNHALNFSLSGETASYSKSSKENFTDVNALLGGRIDIVENVNIALNAGSSKLHEDRGSPNDVAGSEPTKYSQSSAEIGFNHEVSSVRLNLLVRSEIYAYDDTPTSTGTKIDQKGRDRTQNMGSAKISYVIPDLVNAFAQGKYFGRDYKNKDKAKYEYDRSSAGYELTLGVDKEFSDVSKLTVGLGQRTQVYKDADLPDISGPQVEVNYSWTPSETASFILFVNRSIEETIISKAAGFFVTSYGFMYDQEFGNDFLFKLSYNGSDMAYKGIKRTDKMTDAKASLAWYVNDYLYAGLSYNYKERNSDQEGSDYKRGIAMAMVGGRI